VINGRDTYRLQLVCSGHPPQRHLVGEGRVSFDLGPSQITVAVEHADGTWSGSIEPLADQIRVTPRGYVGCSASWIVSIVPAHRTVSPRMAATCMGGAAGSVRMQPRGG
jgi:hypothetical protein